MTKKRQMSTRSQSTQVNDLVFPLLMALLGLWIYFLFPSECFRKSSVSAVAPIIDLGKKKPPVAEVKTVQWIYKDRLELVKNNKISAGDEVEIVFDAKDIPARIVWEIDEKKVSESEDSEALLTHVFDQAGTYLVAARNPIDHTIDTLIVQVNAAENSVSGGNKSLNYTAPEYGPKQNSYSQTKHNSQQQLYNSTNNSFEQKSNNAGDISLNSSLDPSVNTNANNISNQTWTPTTSTSNQAFNSSSNQTTNSELIVQDVIVDNSGRQDKIVEKNTFTLKTEPAENLVEQTVEEGDLDMSSEDKVMIKENVYDKEEAINEAEELEIDEEEIDDFFEPFTSVEAADVPELSAAKDNENVFTPEYFKKENIDFLEELNLEALLRTIAKRGNQIDDQKIEDGAQYALAKVNNNLADEVVLLRQKVSVNASAEFMGKPKTIESFLDDLYLRKNRRENVIKDLDVTDIVYNESGLIKGFSYKIIK